MIRTRRTMRRPSFTDRAAGIKPPPRADGIDLLHTDADPKREVDAESYYGRLHLHWHQLTSVITPNFQYIEAPEPELYDLHADPPEKVNAINTDRRERFT